MLKKSLSSPFQNPLILPFGDFAESGAEDYFRVADNPFGIRKRYGVYRHVKNVVAYKAGVVELLYRSPSTNSPP